MDLLREIFLTRTELYAPEYVQYQCDLLESFWKQQKKPSLCCRNLDVDAYIQSLNVYIRERWPSEVGFLYYLVIWTCVKDNIFEFEYKLNNVQFIKIFFNNLGENLIYDILKPLLFTRGSHDNRGA